MSKLTGKVAVVTGASKGIGAAIAKALAAEGASVVVNYASSKAGADSVVAAIAAAGGIAVAVEGRRLESRRRPADHRCRHHELRPARHPRQQLRRLRVRRDRGGHRRALPPDLQHQRARRDSHDPGGGEAPAGEAPASSISAPGSAGSRRRTRPSIPAPRARSTPSPACSPGSSGRGNIRVNTINPGMIETEGAQTAGFIGSDFEKTLHGAGAARTHRPGRRHRADCRVPRIGRLGLADRRAAARERRVAVSHGHSRFYLRSVVKLFRQRDHGV